MIVIKTNLKKIPNKCNNCKYHQEYYDSSCYCRIEDKPVDYNYEFSGYMQPNWCPLEVDDKPVIKEEGSVVIPNHLEKEDLYYLPVYRQHPAPLTLTDGVDEIIKLLTREYGDGKITVYEDKNDAQKISERMLFEDDCCGVMTLCLSGVGTKLIYGGITTQSSDYPTLSLPSLSKEQLNVISKKKQEDIRKTEAIRSLQNVGILDENGEIKEAYKDIIIKKK